MVLFLSAAGWLATGAALSLLASIKLHAPAFLATCAALTYGRVQPAAWNALAFGFAVPAGLGVALWITARLSGTPLFGRRGIVVAAVLWNLGLAIGLVGILAGDSTGVASLELPLYATPILLAAYLIMAVWGVFTFARRRASEVYIAQWYLLGAFFLFPWLYASASLLAVAAPLRGVLAAAAQIWFTHGLLTVHFGFIGLGATFYFLPKLVGVPVQNRNLAVFGFWTLALFGGLGALQRGWGGPFPAWMLSSGIVGAALTAFPVLAVLMNLVPVLRGRNRTMPSPITLRFVTVGLWAYGLAGVLNVANSFAGLRRFTQFTLFPLALDYLTLLGFVSLAVLGAMYDLAPRLMRQPWPALSWAKYHFGLASLGSGVIVLAYGAGGVVHGLAMNDSSLPYFAVVKRYLPFAATGTLGWLLLLVGACLLALNLARLLAAQCDRVCLPAVRGWLRAAGAPAEEKA
jgi:cytochrome c oxidase cbb3-type subunit 1